MARARLISKFKRGTAIYFKIEVRNAVSDTKPLFSPSSAPGILLRDPLGNVQVNYSAMSEVETGVYTYLYQTLSTGVLGVWQVSFQVDNTLAVVLTPETDAFELVS